MSDHEVPETVSVGRLIITVESPVPLPPETMVAILKRLWSQVGNQSLGDIDPRLIESIRLRLGATTELGVPE